MIIAYVFIPALIGALTAAMATMVGRAIIAAGIGFVTYKGIDVGISALKQSVVDSITGMPPDAVQLLGFLWIDKGLTVIFSAVAIALSMRALGGTLKKAVLK